MLQEAAPWVLLGFLAAGLLKALVPEAALARHLGGRGLGSVLKAALFGAPLPLCSCGVLPAALGLRRQGAGSGATTAFLISTPETGVDSIALTWAMLGPVMALARPLAALVTAVCAGVLANVLDRPGQERPAEPLTRLPAAACGCNGTCGATPAPDLRTRLGQGLAYAFREMLADIGPWLLLGVLVAGAIAALLPAEALEDALHGGVLPHLAMLGLGLPLYVCATASTPVAAALILKGLSPGAALVFLLAGPATNAATLTLVLRLLGRRVAVAYVLAIVGCSLVLGLGLDWLLARMGSSVAVSAGVQAGEGPHWLGLAAALLLLAAMVGSRLPRRALAGAGGKS